MILLSSGALVRPRGEYDEGLAGQGFIGTSGKDCLGPKPISLRTLIGCGPENKGLLKCFDWYFEPLGLESTLIHILIFRLSMITLNPKATFSSG